MAKKGTVQYLMEMVSGAKPQDLVIAIKKAMRSRYVSPSEFSSKQSLRWASSRINTIKEYLD